MTRLLAPSLWLAFVASCLGWGDTSLPGLVLLTAILVTFAN